MNLANLTKEQLIAHIKELEQQARYGLVFKHHKENIVEKCRKNVPVFELQDDKTISNGGKSVKIYNMDCFKAMKKIKDNTIDMIFTDPPYGITQNAWDTIPPLEEMWQQFHRIIKEDGAIVITAAQPFSSQLIMSNLDNFKYDIIWEKTIGSGQLNVNKQPMRTHESILIFYKKQPTYNEQRTEGTPYSIKRKANYQNENYGEQKDNEKVNDGFRHAKSVIKISNPRVKGGHPTQKPVALMEHFIRTFTNEEQVVFDPFMGSGSTGEACLNLGRKFVGIEMDETYFKHAEERLKGWTKTSLPEQNKS
jgi:site-specific DNA-methyltransferase (adenine-specific)